MNWTSRRSGRDERALAAVEGPGVRVYDMETGSVVAFATSHAGRVRLVGYSPDGIRLVTSDRAEARLWNAANGVLLHAYSLAGRELLGFDRHGRLLVVDHRADATWIVDLISGATAGECPPGSLLHLSADGILRCAPATIHGERIRTKGYVGAGLGPMGAALFTTDSDVVYWDGSQEFAIGLGRYTSSGPDGDR